MKYFSFDSYGASEIARAWIITVIIIAYVALIHITGNHNYYMVLFLLILARRDKGKNCAKMESEIAHIKQQLIDRG